MASLIVWAVFIALILAFRISIKRFEARRRAEGAWDENGPINPSGGSSLGTAYSVFDGGLRNAFEREHGREGVLPLEAMTPPPIVDEITTRPDPPHDPDEDRG